MSRSTDDNARPAPPLFDRYLIVDWSAANAPKRGADSLWWSLARWTPTGPRLLRRENPPTRLEAMATLTHLLRREVAAGRRVLAGFDFSFGYPSGAARRMAPASGGGRGKAAPPWRRVWERLAEELVEEPRNRSNRQELAAALNGGWKGAGPFWGHLGKTEIDGLGRKKPKGYGDALPEEFRLSEALRRAEKGPKPKSCWQLAGAGSVGGQSLTGIAALQRLRTAPGLEEAIEVWPFETGLAPPQAPICLAEVYPSLLEPIAEPDAVKDAMQTRTLALALATLDAQGGLAPLFAEPAGLTAKDRRRIVEEEGWILPLDGAAVETAPRAVAAPKASGLPALLSDGAEPRPPAPLKLVAKDGERLPPALRYLKDPAEIYQQSFAIVRREARLNHLPAEIGEVAVRLIHACGMVEIADRLAFSPDVAERAGAALRAGAPVLCDCEMVAAGIMRRALPRDNRVFCALNDPRTPDLAGKLDTTRSAAAVTLWRHRIEGAVVAIGNAPTALFHLLERLDEGWPKPAAILGFPVGFVGAAESKAELAADPRGAAFLTLRGRRGGSAMASAAVNALALLSVRAERWSENP